MINFSELKPEERFRAEGREWDRLVVHRKDTDGTEKVVGASQVRKDGIEKVIQGVRTESVPLGELKKLAGDRLLLFDEELIKFAMGNCVTLEDTNGNRKLYKQRHEQKIDAVAAMMDAYVAYKLNREAFD